MYSISTPTYTTSYPDVASALLVPTGYRQAPQAFDTSAVEILRYFKRQGFDIDILSTPEKFTTLELNGNLKRLGKFAVKKAAFPVFLSIIAAFIYDVCKSNLTVGNDHVTLSISIEVCDSSDMKVTKRIDFEGTAEDFNDMVTNIKALSETEN